MSCLRPSRRPSCCMQRWRPSEAGLSGNSVRVLSFALSPDSWLCVGNGELLTRIDQVGIRDFVAVRHVNFFPLAGIAVDLLGDLAQAVAFLDGIAFSASQSRRAAA